MALWEVWRYGDGDGGRLRFRRPSPYHAVTAFLDRRVATGRTYRGMLQERSIDRVLVCVKDPAASGTRRNPNYPDIHHVKLREDSPER